MKNIIVALIALLSASSYALANDTEITTTTKIGEIWSGYDNGLILFKTESTHINPASCQNNNYYVVDATKTDADKFLSILLTAQSRKADVQVRISKTLCSSGGGIQLH